jgi:hypothetical protein
MKGATIFLTLAALLLLAGGVLAWPDAPYDASWNTVDGGGVTLSIGTGYTLGGTIGQPDAGSSSGGPYSLAGGFWHAVPSVAVGYQVHLPLVLRNF